MKYSDSLFLLIKAMTKSEKKYFKQFSSRHVIGEKNNYVKLFDVIERYAHKGTGYDESLIKAQFSAKFNSQFPVVKNYLYREILESLRMFHGSVNADSAVSSLTEQYDILYGKALYRQAGDILKKAKKIAEENELFPELLKILEREKTLIRVTAKPQEFDSEFAFIYRQELAVIDKLKNITEFSNLRNRMVNFNSVLSSGMARNDEERKQIKEFLSHPLLQSDEMALTKTTKRLSYQYRANLHFWLNELETSYSYHLKYLKECESRGSKFASKEQLFSALYNVCTLQMRLQKDSECEETIEKMRNFEKTYKVKLNDREKNYLWFLTSYEEITFYTQTFRFEEGYRAIKKIEEQLKESESAFYINWKFVIYYYSAILYFTAEDFEKSQKWITKILQHSATDYSSDIQCCARLVNLINHYELKNFEHLDYIMKSTYYFLRKRQRIYKYEQVIIKYMKKSLRVSSGKKLVELFTEMKNELIPLQKDEYERNGMSTFNIVPWLESKIEKIPLSAALMKGQPY